MHCLIIKFIPFVLNIWAIFSLFETALPRDCRVPKPESLERAIEVLLFLPPV